MWKQKISFNHPTKTTTPTAKIVPGNAYPQDAKKISDICKADDQKVAFTLSDLFCVDRHRDSFSELMNIFCVTERRSNFN